MFKSYTRKTYFSALGIFHLLIYLGEHLQTTWLILILSYDCANFISLC